MLFFDICKSIRLFYNIFAVRTRDNGFKSDRFSLSGEDLGGMTFLGMHRCKEELEDRFATPCSMLALRLTADDNPIAACLRLFKRVETTGDGREGRDIDDHLDARSGFTTATMHHSKAASILETKVETVQNRVDMTVVGFMFGVLLHMRYRCILKSRDIYKVYIRCSMIRSESYFSIILVLFQLHKKNRLYGETEFR